MTFQIYAETFNINSQLLNAIIIPQKLGTTFSRDTLYIQKKTPKFLSEFFTLQYDILIYKEETAPSLLSLYHGFYSTVHHLHGFLMPRQSVHRSEPFLLLLRHA